MINKLRVRVQEEKGFTLVELLVVMLILGLLAAIAIPSFFNQRDKARDADAKSGVRTAQTAMETYATDNGGEYNSDTVTDTNLETIEPTLSDVNISDISAGTATGDNADNSYRVTVTSETGNTFFITRHGDGTTEYECTAANVDGCPASTDTDTNGEWD